MIDFTPRKFQQLSPSKQHKICADLLKEIYLSPSSSLSQEWEKYQQCRTWMGQHLLTYINAPDFISDLYHTHLAAAKISLKEHNLLPQVRTGDKDSPHAAELDVSIYLDNLRSAHNVGSIIRTIEAFRLGKLFFSPQTPFIDHNQVTLTSMNAYQWVTCQKIESIDNLPRPLIILETTANATPLYNFHFPPCFTLVVGNEEYGCSQETLKKADAVVEIPLYGRKNSLNVANAFAVAAAEIRRQALAS